MVSSFIDTLANLCGSNLRIFGALGLAFAIYVLLRSIWEVISAVYIHFLGASTVAARLRRYGKWAVVTGCTRGVGQEFVRRLAECGLDIVMIARDEAKMIEISQSIEKAYGVRTHRIVVDFSKGAEVYDSIKTGIGDKEIGILINNVGVMYDHPELFHEITEKRLWELINVNMGAAQGTTHAVLNSSMIPRGKGLIVFMSSLCGYLPSPYVAAYGATKAYDDFLARSIKLEYEHANIHVQSLIPSYLATDMCSYHPLIGRPSLFSPSASTYARHALWTLGRSSRTTGYFPHTVLMWCGQFLPEWCWTRPLAKMTGYFRRVARAEKGSKKKE